MPYIILFNADLWSKSSASKNILPQYADQVGDAGGDELEVLERKEEIQTRLRVSFVAELWPREEVVLTMCVTSMLYV